MNIKNMPKEFISILDDNSPKWIVTEDNELIIEPKNNIYFLLKDVNCDLDLKCKIIAWLSRPSHTGISIYWQKRIRNIFNQSLGTNFSKDEVELIYTHLGNDCNRAKTLEFINSDYDLNVLTS